MTEIDPPSHQGHAGNVLVPDALWIEEQEVCGHWESYKHSVGQMKKHQEPIPSWPPQGYENGSSRLHLQFPYNSGYQQQSRKKIQETMSIYMQSVS